MSLVFSFLLSFGLVALFVRLAHRYGWGKSVRKDGPKSHLVKEGTPTMGGIAFIAAAVLAWLFLGLKSPDAWAVILLTVGAAVFGFVDDVMALQRKRKVAEGEDASTGLFARYRLLAQAIVAAAFSFYVVNAGYTMFALVWLDILAFTFIIMATINAINLSDGLDGLAAGMVVIMLLPFLSHPIGLVFIGSLLGFLWHNSKPASIFMGGVGSEALGAALAGIVITSSWVWYMPLLALVPVVVVLSVIIQVTYFKLTNGKRVFKMAPIHHHFESSGWSEIQVVIRFWLLTALCTASAWLLHSYMGQST